MTEAEWLVCADPETMVEQGLFDRGDCVKLVRFSLACARCLLPWMTDLRSREVVELAERFLEGQVTRDELCAAEDAAYKATEDIPGGTERRPAAVLARYVTEAASLLRVESREGIEVYTLTSARCVLMVAERAPETPDALQQQRVALVSLLRDIFGNPFRPVTVDPAWRTSVVASLAQAAYDERILAGGELDAQRLTVLADALEEAGCSEQAVLDHLRSLDPHVRGCWPVDLILARE